MQSKENKITSCEKDNYLCTQWKQRKQGQQKKKLNTSNTNEKDCCTRQVSEKSKPTDKKVS